MIRNAALLLGGLMLGFAGVFGLWAMFPPIFTVQNSVAADLLVFGCVASISMFGFGIAITNYVWRNRT